jgi:hypothetical protein
MKTFVKKTAVAAILVLLALFLVTCVEGPPEGGDSEEIQYTDVVYDFVGTGDNRTVKSITLYLDGTTVPVPAAQRALGMELAKMSHDYFEAVFIAEAEVTGVVATSTKVARASWEIGQPAGIRGVARELDYANVFPTNGNAAAVIFVGKKSGKTLLGIGHLIQVKEGNAIVDNSGTPANWTSYTRITQNATSVTFGVYPLKTAIGWNGTTLREGFLTATGDPGATTPPPGPYETPSVGSTLGDNTTLRGGASFPVFQLPKAAAGQEIAARYTIDGLAGAAVSTPGNDYGGANIIKPDLNTAARVIVTAVPGAASPYPANVGLELMKRVPSYVVLGQTYDAIEAAIDTYTDIGTSATNLNVTTENQTDHAAFVTTFNFKFIQKANSTGIFAWTFQVPVYAITQSLASNGGPGYERWYIRPGYGPYQYLLDNGTEAGGAVLMGTDVGSLDWLDIFTVGVGFSN